MKIFCNIFEYFWTFPEFIFKYYLISDAILFSFKKILQILST